MAQLLVSVRSAQEARIALGAGASILDVKEPDRGPLGRAPVRVWREVVDAIGPSAPISTALGELPEWSASGPVLEDPRGAWAGLSYRKLGLARSGASWRAGWRALRSRPDLAAGPAWIAVAYADWDIAEAPAQDDVIDEALGASEVAGLLVDTWDKSRRWRVDAAWIERAARVRDAGKLLALAGGIDERSIEGLAAMAPAIVAVRGAACVGGDRRAPIDPARVARLAEAARGLGRRAQQRIEIRP